MPPCPFLEGRDKCWASTPIEGSGNQTNDPDRILHSARALHTFFTFAPSFKLYLFHGEIKKRRPSLKMRLYRMIIMDRK
jgi:hypothetical protein